MPKGVWYLCKFYTKLADLAQAVNDTEGRDLTPEEIRMMTCILCDAPAEEDFCPECQAQRDEIDARFKDEVDQRRKKQKEHQQRLDNLREEAASQVRKEAKLQRTRDMILLRAKTKRRKRENEEMHKRVSGDEQKGG